jgi:hypothetical protein
VYRRVSSFVVYVTMLFSDSHYKAVPLHAMKELGGEEV